MSLIPVDDERRTLPSIFSDIPSNNQIKKARRAVGRMAIFLFIFIGIAAALAVATYLFFSQYKAAEADANGLETQRQALVERQKDYSAVGDLRTDITSQRQQLRSVIYDQRIPSGWQDQLLAEAKLAWNDVRQDPAQTEQLLLLERNDPEPTDAQSWRGGSPPMGAAAQAASRILSEEKAALDVVAARVNQKLQQLRHDHPANPTCNDPRTNDPRCPH